MKKIKNLFFITIALLTITSCSSGVVETIKSAEVVSTPLDIANNFSEENFQSTDSLEETLNLYKEDEPLEEIVEDELSKLTSKAYDDIDYDLTKMSSTMIYSQIYDMQVTPEDYIGKIIRVRGTFSLYIDAKTGKEYHSIVVADALSCCASGLEFEVPVDREKVGETLAIGQEIIITGSYDTYKEGIINYSVLRDAELQY